MVYNLQFMNQSVNFYDSVRQMNAEVDYIFFTLLLGVIFILIFIAFKQYDTKAVLLVDTFITAIIGILFYFLEFISGEMVTYCIIFLIVMIGINVFWRD